MRTFIVFCYALSMLLVLVAHQVSGQVKPLLDNDHVRLQEVTVKVGAKTPEHMHPAGEALYVLSGGKTKVTLPDGTTRPNEYTTGEVRWRATPETHVVENVGTTEIRLLEIHLKSPQGQEQRPAGGQ
jgi:quercetin dioxygenase-like cupin family protein